jgi:hypothetical protein
MELQTMENQAQQNPLSKYFRQPVLYINLPSNGKWYDQGSLELPVTGSIPVFAMTAKDEITFKTPDALLNGQSTISVIESCCPSIKDAWKMPVVDLDMLLISIRIATYGKEMNFTTVCPHCGHKNELAVDLTALLPRLKVADWETPIQAPGMTIHLKPQNYRDFNDNNLANYEEQRLIQMVSSEDLPDDVKLAKFGEMFRKIVDVGIGQVAKNIESITTDDGTIVTNKEHITEFLTNCDRSIWDQLKTRLEAMREDAQIKIETPCENEECGKTSSTPFVFEQSSFFV